MALSLSLDLFLMNGSLFIAVRAQPAGQTDNQTDRQEERGAGDRVAQRRWRRRSKKKRRTEQRVVVNVVRGRRDTLASTTLDRQPCDRHDGRRNPQGVQSTVD